MKMPLSHVTAVMLASCVLSSSVEGQWSVGAEVGADRFWGGTVETTDDGRSFRPYRPTTWGANIQREGPGLGLGLRLGYFSAAMALEGAEGMVAINGVFSVYSVAPEILYRIATVGTANRLLVRAGPLLELWTALDEVSETRIGVHGALALHLPLGWKLEGVLTAGAALIPSPFTEDQLDVSFERRALWRRSITAGLQYRL
jgi:hypothetical protein